jgi:heme exporter protein C
MKHYFMPMLNPKSLQQMALRFLPYAPWVAWSLMLVGAVSGLFYVPEDYQQGNLVRIMYVHVPASWMALGVYSLMASLSAVGLIVRAPVLFILSKSFTWVGGLFTLISLVTGSIWGMPTWGTWWVWDARLTSMLILLFLYGGYGFMTSSGEKSLGAASIFLVIGWVNVPIIKWSVNWWYTLHQPASIMRLSKPAVHFSMLWPLCIMFFGFLVYSLFIGLRSFVNTMHALKERSRFQG